MTIEDWLEIHNSTVRIMEDLANKRMERGEEREQIFQSIGKSLE